MLPLHQPLATLDDDAWDDLLNFIEERRVIPIIGPELLKVETETGPRLLYDWIAEKLAARLNVDTARLPQPYTLNDVVCWYLSSHGRREDTYTRMRTHPARGDLRAAAARCASSRRSPTSTSSSPRPSIRSSSRRSTPSGSRARSRPR